MILHRSSVDDVPFLSDLLFQVSVVVAPMYTDELRETILSSIVPPKEGGGRGGGKSLL